MPTPFTKRLQAPCAARSSRGSRRPTSTSPHRKAGPFPQGVCAGQIDALCGLSQSTVSAHLATLERAGLVTSTRVGQWAFFKRNDAVIQAFLDSLQRGL